MRIDQIPTEYEELDLKKKQKNTPKHLETNYKLRGGRSRENSNAKLRNGWTKRDFGLSAIILQMLKEKHISKETEVGFNCSRKFK